MISFRLLYCCKKLYPQLFLHSSLPVFPTNHIFFSSLFPHFNHRKLMYATELLGVFAVHGSDASPAVASTSLTNNNNCFKIAAFTRPTPHNGVNLKSEKALKPFRCSADSNSDFFSVTSSNKSDVDYLGQSTKGDLNVKSEHLEAFGNAWNFSKILPFSLYMQIFRLCVACFGCSLLFLAQLQD